MENFRESSATFRTHIPAHGHALANMHTTARAVAAAFVRPHAEMYRCETYIFSRAALLSMSADRPSPWVEPLCTTARETTRARVHSAVRARYHQVGCCLSALNLKVPRNPVSCSEGAKSPPHQPLQRLCVCKELGRSCSSAPIVMHGTDRIYAGAGFHQKWYVCRDQAGLCSVSCCAWTWHIHLHHRRESLPISVVCTSSRRARLCLVASSRLHSNTSTAKRPASSCCTESQALNKTLTLPTRCVTLASTAFSGTTAAAGALKAPTLSTACPMILTLR